MQFVLPSQVELVDKLYKQRIKEQALERDAYPMLGKRRYFSKKSRPTKYAKLSKRQNIAFGSGYNPKAMSMARLPPTLERKHYDLGAEGIEPSNAGTTTQPAYQHFPSLNLIPRGTGAQERVGTQITITRLTVRGAFGINTLGKAAIADLTLNAHVRIVVIIDTQNSASSSGPTFAQVFDTGVVSGDSFDVFNNLNNKGRFKVLWDKYIECNAQSPNFPNPSLITEFFQLEANRKFKKTFKLRLPVTFSNDSDVPTLADINTNNIMVFALFDRQTSAQYQSTWVNLRTRVRFVDY